MDRENIIKELTNLPTTIYCGFYQLRITHDLRNKVITLLKEQEAKTGYWIDSAGYDKCSICGAEYSDLYPDYSNTHFCPNCGAKMESGDGND